MCRRPMALRRVKKIHKTLPTAHYLPVYRLSSQVQLTWKLSSIVSGGALLLVISQICCLLPIAARRCHGTDSLAESMGSIWNGVECTPHAAGQSCGWSLCFRTLLLLDGWHYRSISSFNEGRLTDATLFGLEAFHGGCMGTARPFELNRPGASSKKGTIRVSWCLRCFQPLN